jgi:hypothetical protein
MGEVAELREGLDGGGHGLKVVPARRRGPRSQRSYDE